MWDIGTRFIRWGHSATRSDKNDTVWESLIPYPLLSFYLTLTGWPLWSFVDKLTPQLCVVRIRCLLPASETPTGDLMPPTHKGTSLKNMLCAEQLLGGGGGYFHIYSLNHLLFMKKVLLRNADCHQTHVSPASPSRVLESLVCATTPGFCNPSTFCFYLAKCNWS